MRGLLGLLVRTTLVLLLVLMGASVYLWQNGERLLVTYLTEELAQRGITLLDLEIGQTSDPTLHIAAVSLASSTATAELADLTIMPLPGVNYGIRADSLQINLLEQDSGRQPELPATDLLEMLENVLPLLPGTGELAHVSVCAPTCVHASLSWTRTSTATDVLLVVPSLRMHGRVRLSDTTLTTSLYSPADPLVLLATAIQLQDDQLDMTGSGSVQAVASPLSYTAITPMAATINLSSANTAFELQYPLAAPVSVAGLVKHLSGEINFASADKWHLAVSELTLSSANGIGANIRLAPPFHEILLDRPVSIDMAHPSLGKAVAVISEASRCRLTETALPGSGDLKCQSGAIALRAESPEAYPTGDFSTDVSSLAIASTSEAPLADLTATGDYHARLQDHVGDLVDARGVFSIAESILHLSTDELAVSGLGGIQLEVQQDFGTSLGSLRGGYVGTAQSLAPVLQRFDLAQAAILGGSFEASMQADWDLSNLQETTFSSLLVGNDWRVNIDSYALGGGNFHVALSGWPGIETSEPATMAWRSINIGTPLEQVEMIFEVAIEPLQAGLTVKGQSLRATVFGGTIKSHDYSYDVAAVEGRLNLDVLNVSLDEILALEDENLSSEGRLNGSVPIQINKGKVSVSAGSIAAIEPGGFIRYKPSEAVRSTIADDEQMVLVMDALSNFHYHGLDTQLDYSEEGVMVANIALKGSNPEVQSGREIHLNLSLQENVATLLRSLRLGDDIADQFEQRNSAGSQ